MGVTIREVARDAGVSIATVSRVLNGVGPVSEETRQRVLEAIARLRYVPHGAARSLITRRTDTVSVLLPDIHGEFFSELIRGLDRAARVSGYHLVVSGFHSERSEVEAVLRATRGRVDGLIVMTPEADAEMLRANLADAVPVVLLNCREEAEGFDSLRVDNFGGARAVVRHLAAIGHRRIALVKGPPGNFDACERRRGYREAMRELRLGGNGDLEIAGDFTERSGYAAGAKVLAMTDPPTAVFAANDAMAMGFLWAMREARVAVPGSLALVGFDDVPGARFSAPALTSVQVRIDELGARAMNLLLDAIASANGHRRRHETLPATLVVRESCGARAAAAPLAGSEETASNGGTREVNKGGKSNETQE